MLMGDPEAKRKCDSMWQCLPWGPGKINMLSSRGVTLHVYSCFIIGTFSMSRWHHFEWTQSWPPWLKLVHKAKVPQDKRKKTISWKGSPELRSHCLAVAEQGSKGSTMWLQRPRTKRSHPALVCNCNNSAAKQASQLCAWTGNIYACAPALRFTRVLWS